MRGAHAALSPTLGAPATPVPWHAVQTLSKVVLPRLASALPPAVAAPAAADCAPAPAAFAAAICAGAAPEACAEGCCSTGAAGGAGGFFAFSDLTQAA